MQVSRVLAKARLLVEDGVISGNVLVALARRVSELSLGFAFTLSVKDMLKPMAGSTGS
jgi:hypothetical protein